MVETGATRPRIPRRLVLGVSRRRDDQVVAGLASGIADALGVDAAYVRAAFVLTTFASGIGALLYGLGWLATLDNVTDRPAGRRVRASPEVRSRNAGFAVATLGGLLLLGSIGLWPSASLMWTAILVSYGSATIWARSDPGQRARLASVLLPTEEGRSSRRELLIRLAIGSALIIGGFTLFFTTTDAFASVGVVLAAVAITIAGTTMVAGPWIFRLWRQLGEERRERIRSEERTEMAAHLHDSVLQTLALIQRSNDPEEQSVLARIQERELRSWLFDGQQLNGAQRFAGAVEEMTAEVERTHQIAVEVVTVGDVDLDADVAALVAAAREALVNVARHSGTRRASLYGEVTADTVDLFVSDQGTGFEMGGIDPDRRGISESIVGRMQRHGGAATIESMPGEGTEVHLSLPRSQR